MFETLLIIRPLVGDYVILQSARGPTLGTFPTPEEAEEWAKENGYRTHRLNFDTGSRWTGRTKPKS